MNHQLPKYIAIVLFTLFGFTGRAQVFDIIVDVNGNGDYTSVQDALNSIPNYLSKRTLVFIKKGVYSEKVVISSSKTNVSIIGENAEDVIITWDDNPSKNGMSGANTYTFWSDSPGLYAENITFENTSGNAGQAIALRTTGDTMVFKNCRMLGFQDTYYAHKRRQYNFNCYIEGATDFIYGDATAVFDSCTINCVNGGRYITAPADTKLITQLTTGSFLHGLLLRYCNITANSDVAENSYYLGRPWQPNASSVYYECTLGSHIKSEGWSTWGGTNNHISAVFAEYKNVNPDGSLVDVSQRVSWSSQLDGELAPILYGLDFFLGKDGQKWNPKRMTKALSAPGNFTANGSELTWSAVDNAIGYLVLANDSVIGITEANSFVVTGLFHGVTEFAVKSVSKNGNLSKKSSEIATAINHINSGDGKFKILLINKTVQFSEEVNFKIFNLNGVLIKTGRSKNVNLIDFANGIYLITATSKNGECKTKKIII